MHAFFIKAGKVFAVGIFITAILAAVSVLTLCAQANAATGTPNLGTFARDSVQCTGADGDENDIRFTAGSQGRMEIVFEVHTWKGYDYERFLGDELSISVNGHKQYTRGYAVVPAWDGVPGHEPVIELSMRDVPEEVPFYFFTKWAASPPHATSLLVSAYAGEQDCIITD